MVNIPWFTRLYTSQVQDILPSTVWTINLKEATVFHICVKRIKPWDQWWLPATMEKISCNWLGKHFMKWLLSGIFVHQLYQPLPKKHGLSYQRFNSRCFWKRKIIPIKNCLVWVAPELRASSKTVVARPRKNTDSLHITRWSLFGVWT